VNNKSIPDNKLQPFQLETRVAQGRLVRLGETINKVLTAGNYPKEVAVLLGELQVIGGLMSGVLKFDGVLSIQIKGDGAITLLIVDVTSDGHMRGLAKFDLEKLKNLNGNLSSGPQQKVSRFLGNGFFSLTVDQGPDTEPYQGVVSLEGETLVECAEKYLNQSAQLDAALKVVVSEVEDKVGSTWRGGGVLLQKLPSAKVQNLAGQKDDLDFEESWRRAVVFLSSCTNSELLNPHLHPHNLLFRLFSEDGVRVFEPSNLYMKCRCSRERIQNVLASFPRDEVDSMKVNGEVLVTCEFCNADYRFCQNNIDDIFRELKSG